MMERIWNELAWWQCLAFAITAIPLLGYALWRLVKLAWSSRRGASPKFHGHWSARGESRHAQERQAFAEAQAQFSKVMAKSRQTSSSSQ